MSLAPATFGSPQPSRPGPRSTTSMTCCGGTPVSLSATSSAAARVREFGLGLPTTTTLMNQVNQTWLCTTDPGRRQARSRGQPLQPPNTGDDLIGEPPHLGLEWLELQHEQF